MDICIIARNNLIKEYSRIKLIYHYLLSSTCSQEEEEDRVHEEEDVLYNQKLYDAAVKKNTQVLLFLSFGRKERSVKFKEE